MKIAVNTRLLLSNRLEGIGWFTFEALKRITRQHSGHQFYFLFDRPYDKSFVFSDNVTPLVLFPQARHPVLFYLWFEWAVPRALSRIGADLFLSPDGYLSLSTPVKSVGVMHDLNFEHYPKDLPWHITAYYRHYFPRFAAKAARLATVSEFSKQDISARYGIAPEKIDVVYNGAGEQFRPLTPEEKLLTKTKYTQGQEYFLFVGALHPRKNIAGLFRAFDAFRSSSGKPVKLVVTGQKQWWTDGIREAYREMRFREDVIFTGHVSSEELVLLMGSALALTYTSLFEGFGIPIVEAFRAGVPVITSSTSSMPEVSGGAALLADPFSTDSIREAMERVSGDPSLREQMIQKGLNRSLDFSWQQTADRLWDCMTSASGS